MEIVVASGNKGKLREIEAFFGCKVIAFKELVGDLEIEENGTTFAQNALIKAKAIYDLIDKDKYIVISDDSGISVEALNFEPNIYSARYAGVDASDKDNLQKVVDGLNAKGVDSSKAYYTAAIAIVSKWGEYVVHGWMHGDVINTPRGENGFGYDPIFIPNGFDKTLGELEEDVKIDLSHRSKALNLAKPIIKMLRKYAND